MRVTNAALYVIGCFVVGTGWLLSERLPRGRGNGPKVFAGLDRHEWLDWHATAAWVAVALVALHLVLNWRWLLVVANSGKRVRLGVSLASGFALIAWFVWAP